MSSHNLDRRRSSSSNPRERFPDLDASSPGEHFSDYYDYSESEHGRTGSARISSPAKTNGLQYHEMWQTWKDNHLAWEDGHLNVAGLRQHGRQRSIGDAFRNARTRKTSVSESAHEIAEALKAPVSLRILVGESFLFSTCTS